MARSKVDVETRAGRWWVAEESDRWGTYVKPARRDGQRGGTDSAAGTGDKMRSARRSREWRWKGKGAGAGGTAGLPGGETTPNVNTNYSPRASVATATALQPAAALTLPITSAFLD